MKKLNTFRLVSGAKALLVVLGHATVCTRTTSSLGILKYYLDAWTPGVRRVVQYESETLIIGFQLYRTC